MSEVTANIEREVLTLVEYVEDLFEATRAQSLADVYKPNTCTVRYQGDDRQGETGAHDVINRRYEVISFAEKELTGLRQIDELSNRLRSADSIQIKDSKRFMRIGSYNSSAPFLTEDKTTYASLGILLVQVRQAKRKTKWPVIGGVTIRPVGDVVGSEIVIGNSCNIDVTSVIALVTSTELVKLRNRYHYVPEPNAGENII